jgi:hypothetical protein
LCANDEITRAKIHSVLRKLPVFEIWFPHAIAAYARSGDLALNKRQTLERPYVRHNNEQISVSHFSASVDLLEACFQLWLDERAHAMIKYLITACGGA